METIRMKVETLRTLESKLWSHDFLSTWEHEEDTIHFLLLAAEILEDMRNRGLSTRLFDRGLGMAVFRDKSTRTRYAFKSACNLLGLVTEEFEESSSQITHGETVRETATMIGFHTEVFGIRDDLFVGEGDRYMREVATSVEEAYRAGVLATRPSVLNLQSDLDHPTQSLADLRHLSTVFGGLEALRGKRIAVSWAYSPSYGKPLSVPQGLVALLPRFGMNVVLAHPEGYELLQAPLEQATAFAKESGGSLEITHSMEEAFEGADVVYPKSWAPIGVMRERAEAFRTGDKARLAALEKEALAQNARHVAWECNEAQMKRTRGGEALYMHCLPADVSGVSCEHGEVSQRVFEKARTSTYREASYKPYVIAAMILATRVEEPASALRGLLSSDRSQ